MEQLKLLQGEVENEKKERAAVESERNKVSQMGTVDQLNALFSIVVCLLYHQHLLLLLLLRQLQSQLQGLQRQSAVLMTSVSDDEKLTDALLQLEQMQKELQEEKSSSAAKAN